MNPDNLEILLNHLKCAAFELPLREGEKFGRPRHHGALPVSGRIRLPAAIGRRVALDFGHLSGRYGQSLRAVSSDNFVVVDITGEPKVIADVSFTTALTTLHEKAIYLHEAKQFHVEHFDYKERKAYVKRVDCDYYTDAIDYTQVKALQPVRSRAGGASRSSAWRRAGEPADCRFQEDQVLHSGKRGGGEALHAGAGDAHHIFLAAFPGGAAGGSSVYADGETERAYRIGKCAAHGGVVCF